MKDLRYRLEAAGLWVAFGIFRLLTPDRASALGAWIGRVVGPHLSGSRRALDNLKHAFPDKTDSELRSIVIDMWENLGRVIAEYPHLKAIIMEHTDICGLEHLEIIGKENPCVVIAGHLGNWELGPFFFNYRVEWPMAGIYRAPNNPYVEKLLDACRHPEKRGEYIAKSHRGVREMVRTLQEGKRLGNLIDQKYNQGLPIPFFGRPAMTSPAFSQLAARFDCPILPLQVERIKGCKFRITLHQSFRTEGRSDADILEHAHELLEGWIRQRPGQWLWLHRRWDSGAYERLMAKAALIP